jgi:hypothetical protein
MGRMPGSVIVTLVSIGVPVCIVRLWLIWWWSACKGCGFEHRVCVCPPGDHMMRPRR